MTLNPSATKPQPKLEAGFTTEALEDAEICYFKLSLCVLSVSAVRYLEICARAHKFSYKVNICDRLP